MMYQYVLMTCVTCFVDFAQQKNNNTDPVNVF